MKRIRVLLVLAAVTGYCVLPSVIYSCGPFFEKTAFTFRTEPDFPMKDFLKGKLGIVQAELRIPNLFVAYRYLNNQPLSEQEQLAINEEWSNRLIYSFEQVPDPAVNNWLKARHAVAKDEIKISRSRNTGQAFVEYYENCGEDAFTNATQTLQDRVKQFGAQTQMMKDWVEAQDIVFANCEKGDSEPAPAAETEPSLIRFDRAYQVAAAHFYAGKFDKAESEFHAIGGQRESPWSGIAPYLEARAIVRQASFAFDDREKPEVDVEELERAERILKAMLLRPESKPWYRAARERLGLIAARVRPEERTVQLAAMLSKTSESDLLQQEVSDFFWLMRRDHFSAKNEMLDWIGTMHAIGSGDEKAKTYALGQWKSKKSPAWLVAAISADKADDELLAASYEVMPGSPAYMTASYCRVRQGPREAKFMESLLRMPANELPLSTKNAILHEKLVKARSLEEFLSAAARVPMPGNAAGLSKLFDDDAAAALNRQMPLRMLARVAKSNQLSGNTHNEVVKAAWTKAFVLRDSETVKEMTPLMAQSYPEMKTYLERYAAAKNKTEADFAIVDAMLHFPGVTPVVQSGDLRMAKLGELDQLRDNWWCGTGGVTVQNPEELPMLGITDRGWSYYRDDKEGYEAAEVSFLSKAEKSQAAEQWKQMMAIEPGKTFLPKKVLAFQKIHPEDERVPAALDLSLRALRYGCSVGQAGLAHKVFDVLHRKYPKSTAAKRNRPWGEW
jgi:hypothetical protein